MKIDSFMPVKIISSRDCFNDNCELISQFGARCLVVTGGSSARKSGALEDVKNALEKMQIAYTVFDSITQNPFTVTCYNAGEVAREFGAEFIIGIGGGSPLDASKAIAIYAANENIQAEEIYVRKNIKTPLPIILVGTTAGTGSEVTGVSVLTNSSTGMKKSISGKDCYAKVSFCDYQYTSSMPYNITVSTALDAFSHAVESYFSKTSNELSELYAEKAISELWQALKYFHNAKTVPEEVMRESVYDASILAGLAINITGTCFPHTVGYILTEDFAIPHGKACAAFMRDFLEISVKNCPGKADKFFRTIGTDKDTICDVVDELSEINVKISSDKYEKYKGRWSDSVKNFDRTPGNFTKETAYEILGKFVKS